MVTPRKKPTPISRWPRVRETQRKRFWRRFIPLHVTLIRRNPHFAQAYVQNWLHTATGEPMSNLNLIDHTHPGIWRAALEIALANNGINRNRSEEDLKQELTTFIAERLSAWHSGLRSELIASHSKIDSWLQDQSDKTIQTICDGEETESEAILVYAPRGTSDLLNAIFENVC